MAKGGRQRSTGKGKVSVGAATRDTEAALEDAAYAEAEQAIAKAQLSGAKRLVIRNSYLRRLPQSIASLTALETLRLEGTVIADLAPLAGLTALKDLSLHRTAVADLAPIARLTALQDLRLDGTHVADLAPLTGLTALQTLRLTGTAVADIAPLADHPALHTLRLSDTAVTDLAPLAGNKSLQSLSLTNTAVTDLAPLAGLTALRILWLDGTRVANLAPLAGLTDLLILWLAYTPVADLGPIAGLIALQSLSLDSTPVATRRPFDLLAEFNNPARAVETINYLRRQQGLEEYWPEGYERPAEIVEFWKGFEAKKHDNEGDEDVEAGDTDPRALEQRPAPDVFTVVDGKIVGRPYRGQDGDQRGPDQPEMAADLHAAALEKLNDVLAPARAGRLQIPDRMRRTLERLEKDLGKIIADVADGRLISASRTLSADVSAYDTEFGRKELPEGVLAAFIDLNDTVIDLMACYPSIARVEASRIALNLEPPQVEAAMKGMREIREAADKTPEIVSDSAKESLARDADTIAEFDRDAKNPSVSAERQRTAIQGRNRLVAYSLLTYRNFVAQLKKLAASVTPSDETLEKLSSNARKAGAKAADFGKRTAGEIDHYGPGQTGVGTVAGAISLLLAAIAGPTAGLALFLPMFLALSKLSAKKADDQTKKATAPKPAKPAAPKSNPKPKTPKHPKT